MALYSNGNRQIWFVCRWVKLPQRFLALVIISFPRPRPTIRKRRPLTCKNDRSKQPGTSVQSQQFHEKRYQSYGGNCTKGQRRHQCFGFLPITRAGCTDVLSAGFFDQAKYDAPITPMLMGSIIFPIHLTAFFPAKNQVLPRC
jgi:hypothetical protein